MSILGLIKSIIDLILAVPGWITALINRSVQNDSDKRTDGVAKGVEDAKNAKTLQEKADAACTIEKALNPDSNCDVKPGS